MRTGFRNSFRSDAIPPLRTPSCISPAWTYASVPEAKLANASIAMRLSNAIVVNLRRLAGE
jgi:hypothetical protein